MPDYVDDGDADEAFDEDHGRTIERIAHKLIAWSAIRAAACIAVWAAILALGVWASVVSLREAFGPTVGTLACIVWAVLVVTVVVCGVVSGERERRRERRKFDSEDEFANAMSARMLAQRPPVRLPRFSRRWWRRVVIIAVLPAAPLAISIGVLTDPVVGWLAWPVCVPFAMTLFGVTSRVLDEFTRASAAIGVTTRPDSPEI